MLDKGNKKLNPKEGKNWGRVHHEEGKTIEKR